MNNKKESFTTEFLLFILKIMLLAVLACSLLGIFLKICLTPSTPENYVFKIIIGDIITVLVTYLIYVHRLMKDLTIDVQRHKIAIWIVNWFIFNISH